MAQPSEFTVSAETANELLRCRADANVRLDVSSTTFPTTTIDTQRLSDVQATAAERLLGAVWLFVNETLIEGDAKNWVPIMSVHLHHAPRHLLKSPRSHSVRFEDRLTQGLIKRFGLKEENQSALDRLGTDLFQWIKEHRGLLEDQYRLDESRTDPVVVEAKGHAYPSPARILGEPKPREHRVEARINRGK